MTIRPAAAGDVNSYLDHMFAHMRESGGPNRPVFHPVEDFEKWNREEHAAKLLKRWETPIHEIGWERTWLLEIDGKVVGDANLRGPGLATALHRCTLGIGIQESARGLGHGSELIETLLTWAQAQDSLFWIDLNVFSHNKGAVKLYESFGFLTYGARMDQFRVHGHSVDTLDMALQLREE